MLRPPSRWLALAFLCGAPALHAQATIVISQVYGGGGSTATQPFQNDFVELFNRGQSPVTLDGWSVQYSSAAGASWSVTPLNGELQPGQYLLVQLGAAGAGAALPTPDVVGQTNLSATAGKVVLVRAATALAGTCPLDTGASTVEDFVGYGSGANCAEGGAPTATLDAASAARRDGDGCQDSNRNNVDFVTGVPAPRNRQTVTTPCPATPEFRTPPLLPTGVVGCGYDQRIQTLGGNGAVTIALGENATLPPGLAIVEGRLRGVPTSSATAPFRFILRATDAQGAFQEQEFTLTVRDTPPNTIAEIQGRGDRSPFPNGTVVTFTGVITGYRSNGFFVQMPGNGDGDPATSDGLFIFQGARPAQTDAPALVCITGPVLEFAPVADGPTLTEISRPTSVTRVGDSTLPAAIALTAAELGPGSDPQRLERLEGMRVRADALVAVSATEGSVDERTATARSLGAFFAVLPGTPRPFREPGIEPPEPLPQPGVPRFDGNPERLRVEGTPVPDSPLDVTAGATITGLSGPLDYQNGTWTLVAQPNVPHLAPPPGETPAAFSITGNRTSTPVRLPQPGELLVSSLNVERLFDTTDDPSISDVALTPEAFERRLRKASLVVRSVLREPDILGVVEVENLPTLRLLADRINADRGTPGDYQAYLVEGNDIGGIDVGFLVKSSRVRVSSVTQAGKEERFPAGASTPLNDRPPLILQATAGLPGGAPLPLTVIVNHLRSLRDVTTERVQEKRRSQAEFLADLVQRRQQADPGERIVLVGDFNAFPFSDGYVDVIGTIRGTPAPAAAVALPSSDRVNPDLTNLLDTLPVEERYSFVFNGNAQVLDHVLVNEPARTLVSGFAIARSNADFPDVYRNDPARPERLSDHDAPVAYLRLPDAGVEVTGRVEVSVEGFLYDARTGTYEGVLTVTNPSPQAIAGPLRVVVEGLPAGMSLVPYESNRNMELPYLTLLPGSQLNPGQYVRVPVRFRAPANSRIIFRTRVFAV